MTNTQNTPGPCHVCNPAEEGRTDFDGPLPYIHDETGDRIATLEGDGEPFLLYARIFAEAPAMLDALRWVSDFLAVKLDEGQACIIEDEVNAILSRIDGDAAPEV